VKKWVYLIGFSILNASGSSFVKHFTRPFSPRKVDRLLLLELFWQKLAALEAQLWLSRVEQERPGWPILSGCDGSPPTVLPAC
jgi:hypothetical protein